MSYQKDYDSVKKYEYFKSKLGIFIGILVLIGTAIIGYHLYNNKNPHTKEIQAKITKIISCNSRVVYNNNFSTTYFDCLVDIEYTIDNKTYQHPNYNTINNTYPLQVGGSVRIAYNPNDPSDISRNSSEDDKKAGMVFFVIGVIYLLINIGYFVINKLFPGVAFIRGVKNA